MTIDDMDEIGLPHIDGWVYGSFLYYGNTPYIVGDFIEVDEEYTVLEFYCPVEIDSVGQYTGINDIEDTEIYERDVLQLEGYADMYVEFSDGDFVTKSAIKVQRLNWQPLRLIAIAEKGYKVIGNIHENPELLEV